MGAKLVHGLFSSKMHHFTLATFDSSVMHSEQTAAVLYYAPWCGYCKQFKPEFEAAAKKLKGLANVGAVNCDEEKALCAQAGIQGFPVLKVYYTNAKSKKRVPIEFNGERTAKAVQSFVVDRLPNFVKSVRNEASLERFYALENSTLPKLLVVKPPAIARKGTTPLLKALAIDYHYRLVVGEVQGASAADPVYADFAAPAAGATSIVAVSTSGERTLYSGEVKQKPLRAFLDQHASPTKVTKAKKPKSIKTKMGKPTADAGATSIPAPAAPGSHDEL
ncbi:thioredoxin-like protein [Blastocladiella britannica]|nr:thioredoxin-like protein [Blastocladiella britannica]